VALRQDGVGRGRVGLSELGLHAEGEIGCTLPSWLLGTAYA
jgi:hypothetical protein